MDIEKQPAEAIREPEEPDSTHPRLSHRHHHNRRSRFRRLLVLSVLGFSIYHLYKAHHSSSSSSVETASGSHDEDQGLLYHNSLAKAKPSITERIEQHFLSVPDTKYAFLSSRRRATHPHLAGAPEDYEDAKDVLAFFQYELGITSSPSDTPIYPAGTEESRNATLSTTSTLTSPNAWVDVYYPLMNDAKSENLQLHILGENGDAVWTADLVEDGDEGDADAAKYKDSVAPFHGLSSGGEAEGELIYANYGTKDDYDQLVASGVDVTGKIVLARYGANFRGLKVQGAEALGAAGVLIYSDPRDDGSVTVENGYEYYPAGPARNPTSIQRGSVMYLSTYPGDPTTPGYPAYENATRIEPTNVPHTPSLPLSWANAQRLLAELGGVDEGRVLNGKISEKKVKLVNNVDTKVTPIWNTMAAIPGHIKDEVVILGCHRDAWVMGAVDPISGTVSMYEVIRGLGSLLRRGWKPLRTIVIASWDAEEYGLIGSTEWAEDFADWIQQHAVSYVNVDVSVAGSRLAFSASPSLAHLMKRTAQDVPHPTDPERTLWDAQFDVGPFSGELDADFAEQHAKHESKRAALTTGIDALGSGSDYTVFLQRLGVASSDQGFGSTPMDAVYHYHSIYDSEQWSELYGDPGFLRRVAVAKSLGLLTLRLADSIVLPLNTTQYAYELDLYLDRVEDAALSQDALPKLKYLRKAITKLQSASLKLDKEKAAAEKNFRKILKRFARGRRFHAAVKRAIKWLKKHLGIGKGDADHEHGCKGDGIMGRLSDPWSYLSLDEGDLERLTWGEKAKHGKFPVHKLPLRKFIKAAQRVRRVNKKLSAFEQGFISEGGIKDREWYKHLGVAPGKYLGYGATTLPALTEAVLYEQNATLAKYEAHRLTKLIENLAHNLKV